MRINESLRDRIVNSGLSILSFIRSKVLKSKKLGYQDPDTSNMNLIFYDDFKSFIDKNWRIGQPWGIYHPDYKYQYYGEDTVTIKNKSLNLSKFYSPKIIDGNEISYSVGLVTSYQSFGYGFFRFVVELPKGIGLWPAVWLSCVDSWPPEIDILEAYSDKDGEYGNDLQTNLHYNFTPKESSGARNHLITSSDNQLIVSCWWTENFIKFYYNGYLVRQITSKETLKWFKNKKMLIILNNAIRSEYQNNLNIRDGVSDFKIFEVRVYS